MYTCIILVMYLLLHKYTTMYVHILVLYLLCIYYYTMYTNAILYSIYILCIVYKYSHSEKGFVLADSLQFEEQKQKQKQKGYGEIQHSLLSLPRSSSSPVMSPLLPFCHGC